MSDYTPTTQAVRVNYIIANARPYRGGGANAAASFDRWLAQYTAEKRAEWEAEVRAGVAAEEPEGEQVFIMAHSNWRRFKGSQDEE